MLPLSSPPLRAGTPPPMIADKIVRSRKGNPPQIVFGELSEAEIEATLDCLVESNGLTDAFLLNAIGIHTRRLNLTSCYHIRKYTLGMIAQQCLNLEAINLSNCRQADNKLVSNLLSNCLSLRELILDGCVRITDAAFFPQDAKPSQCIRSLARLQKLSLAGCRQISEDAISKIAYHGSSLREFNLAGCRNSVTTGVVTALFDSSLKHRNLIRIDLSDCSVLSSDEAFVDYQLKLNFSHQLLPIQSITLAGLSGLPPRYTSKAIQAIAQMCGPNLVELDTTWSSSVNDEACYVIANHCSNVKILNLCNSQISWNGVEMLVQHLVALESLDLAWCLKVNALAVEAIAKSGTRLRSLNISHCVDFLQLGSPSRGPITTESILSLIAGCGETLERLELTGLAKVVTPEVLLALANDCPYLSHLAASLGGENASELASAFESFASMCESLTHLIVDVSRIASDRDILSEALKYPNFPNLIKLSLVAHSKQPFGDEALEAILVNRIGLEHLELRNCADISCNLFQTWIQGYNPDKEATLLVEAMLESELQKGYMSSTSNHTVLQGRYYSDSDAPTVIFRGKAMNARAGKNFKLNNGLAINPISSCSETDTNIAGFELLRKTLVLGDAARAMDCLKSLTLVGAQKLTDASLDRLSLMMTYMQSLEVIDAPLMTDDVVEPLRRRCRLLRALEITGPKLRVRIDSSRFFNRRHRRKGQLPPETLLAMKRKLKDSDDEDDD